MKAMGLQGVVRSKKVVTTNPGISQPCPDDKVNRTFAADMPNELCPYGICTQTPTGQQVSVFTYVSTWLGVVYVAFLIEVLARRIVGWRVSTQ